MHSRASKWAVESETNRNSVIPHIVRRMIGFYNHLGISESPIIIDSLKLYVELNEEGTSVKKIGEALSTPNDLLINSKVLLNKRLNKSTSTGLEPRTTYLVLKRTLNHLVKLARQLGQFGQMV